MEQSVSMPYFAQINCQADGSAEAAQSYIGKIGVVDEYQKAATADWCPPPR